jgi:hypothetical protein
MFQKQFGLVIGMIIYFLHYLLLRPALNAFLLYLPLLRRRVPVWEQ